MLLRRVAAVLLAATLAAACTTDDGSSAAPVGAGPTTVTGGTPATQPAEQGSLPSDTAASGPTADGEGDASATTTVAPPATEASAPAASPAPAPGSVGSYAPFYLRPEESGSILLDVHSQAGAEPRVASLDHVSSVLGRISGKAVAITQGALPGEGRQWTSEDLRALADSAAPAQSRNRAVLTVLYVHGGFAEEDKVIGVSVRSDVAAVFSDKVADAAGVLGNPAAVEDAVSMHEVGHILGLVDLFLNTGRQDPDHPGHSPNKGSVMYYAVESTLINTILSGGPPRDFDQADLEDLTRIRNG